VIPIRKLFPGRPCRSGQSGGFGTGLAGPPNDRGALVGVAVGWPPGEEGIRAGTATETGIGRGPL
jgi:hypothetical protein